MYLLVVYLKTNCTVLIVMVSHWIITNIKVKLKKIWLYVFTGVTCLSTKLLNRGIYFAYT